MLSCPVNDLGVAGPEGRLCPEGSRETKGVGIRETAVGLDPRRLRYERPVRVNDIKTLTHPVDVGDCRVLPVAPYADAENLAEAVRADRRPSSSQADSMRSAECSSLR